MSCSIAVVGMACRFPDARSPDELWENVLAQRRAFRRLPNERLNLHDYYSVHRETPDATYATEAAVIEGYEFDRTRFRVAGNTFRSADMAHWLALEVASDALADADFTDGKGLPNDASGVLLGNSLTGEFSRSNLMRLRWPYVRRVVDDALTQQSWSDDERAAFLSTLETKYKEPFPAVGDETLAGGLSNTIAGRICNHFDLQGGGYTVDGACASSLLAIANACSALVAGDLDVALAGGVDLSLDPFELIGFAKVGALAEDEMRVFDARSAGFWPGEGCGVVVLMRLEDAVKQCRRIHAVVRGWGISSDGSGGLTRPEVAGQRLALRRAYRRAGCGIESVGYFEGHGTGTVIGDTTELRTLSQARRQASSNCPVAAIGSIKANIGHTKAASGVAGFIKAAIAIREQLVPPTTGWETPHPVLAEEDHVLELLHEGKVWPSDAALLAGVSGMGFGGINAHIVLEDAASERRSTLANRERSLMSSRQDAELFLLSGRDRQDLNGQVQQLLSYAARLSRSDLIDLAARLASTADVGPARAALIASDPAELRKGLEALAASLASESNERISGHDDVLFASRDRPPRIGFLFSGQGSPANLTGGLWQRRFRSVASLYEQINLPRDVDGVATEIAQPAIVTASLAGLRVLSEFKIEARVALGHSLGELVAYGWAGALDETRLLRLATARGRAISQCEVPGAMASIEAAQCDVEPLLEDQPLVIAALNSPKQTVISGEVNAVEEFITRAKSRGIQAIRLPVSHAFHSPLVADAASRLSKALATETFLPLNSSVMSTVTGGMLDPRADIGALMVCQITSPVRFMEALQAADPQADLWIEVGPGSVLQRIVSASTDTPAVALDAGGDSLRGLLRTIGMAFVMGAPIRQQALFDERFRRAFDLDWKPRFLTNPCERAPNSGSLPTVDIEERTKLPASSSRETPSAELISSVSNSVGDRPPALDVVRQLAAERAELPLSAVRAEDRLLSDLHLSSIAVGQLFVDAARTLDLAPPESPTDAANATVAEVAQALEELAELGSQTQSSDEAFPPGVDAWTRAFTVEWLERPLPRHFAATGPSQWEVLAPKDHMSANAIRQALGKLSGKGVVVCLPTELQDEDVDLLLEAAQRILADRRDAKFVLVLNGGVGAAFARSLALELRDTTTCVVDVPENDPRAVDWVLAEVQAAVGYCEAKYDAEGVRREPVLRLLPLPNEEVAVPLDSDDVMLVTGGGKGIAAECAFALAKETGARLALIGRSRVDEDKELAANLERMTAAGVSFKYLVADVTDTHAVQAAVSEIQSQWGQVTAVLHAAGVNKPQRLKNLDRDSVRATLRPKVTGAQNLLSAIEPEHLRLFVTFGSIIGRAGMAGQADYALANEWLTKLTEAWQTDHPHCHCLALEWSVWSGVGMGERLGTVDALKNQGISPITIDDGLKALRRLISTDVPCPALVVTGRFGNPPTLKLDTADLPLLRFLERPRVFVPGVELVAESDVSLDTDPYLKDHVYQRVPLLPAVMGLEAIVQVAMTLIGGDRPPVLENVRFDQPIVVSEHSGATLRVAALRDETGQVNVVLRSSDTGFQQDHFSAVCRECDEAPVQSFEHDDGTERLSLEPQRDLYGGVLFHTGRFQRLRGYRRLQAKECIAEISPTDTGTWFGQYLPSQLVLGDAAARDAVIHAIQACIPHHTLLPIGVERLTLAAGLSAPFTVHAREVSQDDDVFTYNLDIVGNDGVVCEQWKGLRLRRVNDVVPAGSWHDALLRPYIERRVGELLFPAQVSVVVERNGADARRDRSRHAIHQAVGLPVDIHTRPDGKPEVACDAAVSVSHAADVTMAVAGRNAVACDAEPVVHRADDVWRDLLGEDRLQLAKLIAQRCHEDSSTSTTRVWAAQECLKKSGAAFDSPLIFDRSTSDGWTVLTAGSLDLATWVAPGRGEDTDLVFAILVRSESACV